VEGTNKAHENGEAMGLVGVRLTVMLGHGYWFWVWNFMSETAMQARQKTHLEAEVVLYRCSRRGARGSQLCVFFLSSSLRNIWLIPVAGRIAVSANALKMKSSPTNGKNTNPMGLVAAHISW
jgi:hypothetical protein